MILKDKSNCKHVNIVGDGVQGFFNLNNKSDYENILFTAAVINSFTKLINCEFTKNNITPINIGIGISCGRALITKVGIVPNTDIIWIGDVVNKASDLCNEANKKLQPVAISDTFYDKMPNNYQGEFLYSQIHDCYHSYFHHKEIEAYVLEHYVNA